MAIYIGNQNRIKDIFINVNGRKKRIESMWVDKNGMPTKVYSQKRNSIVSWSNGTDDEIAAMLDAHYNGDINIHDYWKVGDERTIHLSAMEKSSVQESHIEQDVTMVLVNAGGKYLQDQINDKDTCAFIVCQKDPLIEPGIMNLSGTENGINYDGYSGWGECRRRTWCNETYKYAFPEKFRKLFKLHKNYSGDKNNIRYYVYDYFALLSEKEFCGVHASSSSAETFNNQFTYFKNIENQKTTFTNTGQKYAMWTRSTANESVYPSNRFACILSPVDPSDTDIYSKDYVNRDFYIRPFGCI